MCVYCTCEGTTSYTHTHRMKIDCVYLEVHLPTHITRNPPLLWFPSPDKLQSSKLRNPVFFWQWIQGRIDSPGFPTILPIRFQPWQWTQRTSLFWSRSTISSAARSCSSNSMTLDDSMADCDAIASLVVLSSSLARSTLSLPSTKLFSCRRVLCISDWSLVTAARYFSWSLVATASAVLICASRIFSWFS